MKQASGELARETPLLIQTQTGLIEHPSQPAGFSSSQSRALRGQEAARKDRRDSQMQLDFYKAITSYDHGGINE
jgi:hypothetical protein